MPLCAGVLNVCASACVRASACKRACMCACMCETSCQQLGERLMTSTHGREGQTDLKFGTNHRLVFINQHAKFQQIRRRTYKCHPGFD